MGAKLLRVPTQLADAREQFEVIDHFPWYVDAHQWTKLAADAGSAVAHEGPGRSRVKLNTGATDNNEACLASTDELFKFVGNKPIIGEWRIEFAEAATDDANIAVGFADAAGANLITDNGGGITATDAILIYKVDGGTKWKVHTEINTLANKAGDGSSGASDALVQSNTTAGGSSAQVLRIEALPRSSTVFEVRFFVDGVLLKDSNGVAIMHAVALGTATDMDMVAGYVKAGGATDEILYVDYAYGGQAI